MKTKTFFKTAVFFSVAGMMTLTLGATTASAHCDAKNGPVAVDARQALAEDDFEEVAIWVGEKQHKDLRAAFDQAIAVYQKGGKARALAEQYFMETAVRLHREAEGMSYTGLKSAQTLPEDIEAAEKALETGDLDPVTNMLRAEMKKKLRHVFENARKASQKKDQNLEAGRKWADAYVRHTG